MEIQLIPLEKFQSFLLCLLRVAALVSSMPVIGSRQVPIQFKVGLTGGITILLFPLMEPLTPALNLTLPGFGFLVVNEVLLGLLLGLSAQLIFTAVELGGNVIGIKMGFAAANVFDPQSQQQVALVSRFQSLLAMLIFLALDGHHIFLRLIVKSYAILPPGQLSFSGASAGYLVELTGKMFVLGVQFAAPVLAILIITSMVLGVMARVFPQLNVFMLSFPVNIGVAFLVIGLTLNLSVLLLRREFDFLGQRLLTFFNLL